MALKSGLTVRGLSGQPHQVRHGHSPKENYESEKTNVRCKCPKCGQVHAVFMHWAGRGIPRIYCRSCRPMVSTFCDAGYSGSPGAAARSHRKSGHQVFE